jgi:hypothetical protein
MGGEMSADYVIELSEEVLGQNERPATTRGDGPKRSFSVAAREDFFARVTTQLKKLLPPDLNDFTARPMFIQMKVAYANERVHYEVGIDVHLPAIEIALHFEDGPASTLQYLAYFDRQIVELKEVLGHEIELERWTNSWGRIYELWPLDTLDRSVADRVAKRLAEYIATLQPHVNASKIRPELAAKRRSG